jgi:hypothetical protein
MSRYKNGFPQRKGEKRRDSRVRQLGTAFVETVMQQINGKLDVSPIPDFVRQDSTAAAH